MKLELSFSQARLLSESLRLMRRELDREKESIKKDKRLSDSSRAFKQARNQEKLNELYSLYERLEKGE